MVVLRNRTHSNLHLATIGRALPAGEEIEVDDDTGALFADHPLVEIVPGRVDSGRINDDGAERAADEPEEGNP